MSRVYEALQRATDTKFRVIAENIPGPQPEANHVNGDSNHRTPVAAPVPGDSQAQAPPEAPAIAVAETPATTLLPAPLEAPPTYRIVGLHVKAGVPVFPFDGTDARASEQYRVIRTNLLQHPVQPKVIGISSPSSGDGKTISAINIAGICALRSNSRVLLIDADMRRTSVAKMLGIVSPTGLSDVLRGQVSLADAICQVEQLPNLCVLTCGSDLSNPAELLDSANWIEIIAQLRQLFSLIVIDMTPVMGIADFKLARKACDGVLMVIRPDHTDRVALSRALEIGRDPKFLGVVVNAFKEWPLWKTEEQYGYPNLKA